MTLIEKIKQANRNNDELFAEIINEFMAVNIVSEQQLALRFSASLPAIERWKSGAGAPHPIMRESVYKYLIESLENQT